MCSARRFGWIIVVLAMTACLDNTPSAGVAEKQSAVSASDAVDVSADASKIETVAAADGDEADGTDAPARVAGPGCPGPRHVRHRQITRRLVAALRAWVRDRDVSELRSALGDLLLRLAHAGRGEPGDACVGSHTLHLTPVPGGCLDFPFDAPLVVARTETETGFSATFDRSTFPALTAPACDGLWCAVSFTVVGHGHGAPPFAFDFVLQLGPVITGTMLRHDLEPSDNDCRTTYQITAD